MTFSELPTFDELVELGPCLTHVFKPAHTHCLECGATLEELREQPVLVVPARFDAASGEWVMQERGG